MKNEVEARAIDREIRILKQSIHMHIVKLYEVIDSPTNYYLVMECAARGDLASHLEKKGRLKEAEAAKYLVQTVEGIAHCHARGVIHRDIKPENLLLDANFDIKVTDFGLSAIIKPGQLLKVACGTPSYSAPEVIGRKEYDGTPHRRVEPRCPPLPRHTRRAAVRLDARDPCGRVQASSECILQRRLSCYAQCSSSSQNSEPACRRWSATLGWSSGGHTRASRSGALVSHTPSRMPRSSAILRKVWAAQRARYRIAQGWTVQPRDGDLLAARRDACAGLLMVRKMAHASESGKS